MIYNNRNDAEYLLPENLIELKDISKYENEISKIKNIQNDEKASRYKFNEKRSLIEYYKQFYEKIENHTIYNYLDLKKEYYEDDNWKEELENMLNKFRNELKKYFGQLKEKK